MSGYRRRIREDERAPSSVLGSDRARIIVRRWRPLTKRRNRLRQVRARLRFEALAEKRG